MPNQQLDGLGTFVPRMASTLVQPWNHTAASSLSTQTPKAKLSPIQSNSAILTFLSLHRPQRIELYGLQVVARALTGAAPPTSISQVDAIANFWENFESWRLLAPLACWPTCTLQPGRPSVPTHEPPKVISLPLPTPSPPWVPIPSCTPLPRPAAYTLLSLTTVPPYFQATPRRLNFSGAPSPRVVIEPWHP
jgi:hypothetical protein